MSSTLQVITEQNVLGKEFRVYGSFENPLFLAKDVAEWIDYSKTSKGAFDVSNMIKSVDEDERLVRTIFVSDTSGSNNVRTTSKARNTQEMWFLTENGLYEVLFLSRKPIAKEFKKAVKKILHELRTGEKTIVKVQSKTDRELDILEKQVATERANLLHKLANEYEGKSKTYKQILDAHATKELTGEFLLPLPSPTKKTYSATEIGEKLGISANKVGIIANKYKLKTEEFGEWQRTKSKYSAKELDTFVYYDSVIEKLKELV